ncbi:MAG: PEP-CTERM sorting domain-containing protein [Okeania sp. SIO3H1]|uniref:PEP-CTERM sorting domain-containing protein n=1 Tax=Okeania sp. SIO1I7 TaxID=2607772 RepID=UPI0013CA6B7B|nr:PEP-CTERM sorting domain-containing protein [Okeania sp. SIO1I7]NEN91433.1 PEP-CTERM sorting domain-containing protein [Okeania sp. SIO3H1]NET24907.1 PEP-CTERM sorting domain-containing protein [Okeania sp. SIO1I7]
MKNIMIAALVSAPLAVATVFNAGTANAAVLSGNFSFDGAGNTISFDENMLDFAGDEIVLSLQNGDFAGLDSDAKIFDISSGLAALDGMDTVMAPVKFIELSDGTTLNLTSFNDFTFTPQIGTTDINLGFSGFFLNNGDVTDAAGSITFQVIGELNEDSFAGDETFEASFSGVVFGTEDTEDSVRVPEPSTMLGLGVVAAAFAFGLKKKNS